MYMHPEWDVDPNLYRDYALDRSDVDEEHRFLIPIMEKLEQGEQVDVTDIGFSGMLYLQQYYSSKRNRNNPYLNLTFIQRVNIIDHVKHWMGHLILPHVPNAEFRRMEAEEKARNRKVEKRKRTLTGILFVRELIRMFFGW